MWRYYELLSLRTTTDITNLRQQAVEGRNPRDIKVELALEITSRFHGDRAARIAQEGFAAQFSRRGVPQDIPLVQVVIDEARASLSHVLKAANLAASTSEARRAIAQNAVRVDDVRIEDVETTLQAGKRYLIQSGKRKFSFVDLEKRN